MKTLRVKQNRVQTTVRRRQYDDRRENCRACIYHRFSVAYTTAILIIRFVSNSGTGFILWFGWKQQNIFARLFLPTVNRQKNFWVGFFVRRYFSPATSAENEICSARPRASKQTKNQLWLRSLASCRRFSQQRFGGSLWRSPCVFCSAHKRNLHAGAWFASTNDGDGAWSKLCISFWAK